MSASATSSPAARPPIFAKPIPIIGLTGDFESGKTRFMLSLAPGPDTLIFDTEDSSATYEEIGAKRVDIPREMLRNHPAGYKPIDVFTWWHAAVKAIPPGKFRVIALDVAEDIEAGLADWVWENPMQFNHTRNQYLRASGIFWGDVKSFWKPLLLDLRARCEIFTFAVHLGSVWGNDSKPTGAKRPKGKSTLMELATLFLHLERPTAADGSKPEAPAAKVLKTRLSHNVIVNGDLITKAILPPRLPVATVQAIRAYIAKPANFSALTADELAPAPVMSDDERAAVRLATAQAEGDASRMRLEVMEAERRNNGRSSAPVTAPIEIDPVDLPAEPEGETLQEALHEHAPSLQQINFPEPPAAITMDVPTDGLGQDAPLESPTPVAEKVENSPPAYVRPTNLPSVPSQSIHMLWEEHSHLQGMTSDQKFAALKAILTKFNANRISELTPESVAKIEETLVTAIRSTYQSRGMSNACPFPL